MRKCHRRRTKLECADWTRAGYLFSGHMMVYFVENDLTFSILCLLVGYVLHKAIHSDQGFTHNECPMAEPINIILVVEGSRRLLSLYRAAVPQYCLCCMYWLVLTHGHHWILQCPYFGWFIVRHSKWHYLRQSINQSINYQMVNIMVTLCWLLNWKPAQWMD
jgi:hypothetical protein